MQITLRSNFEIFLKRAPGSCIYVRSTYGGGGGGGGVEFTKLFYVTLLPFLCLWCSKKCSQKGTLFTPFYTYLLKMALNYTFLDYFTLHFFTENF